MRCYHFFIDNIVAIINQQMTGMTGEIATHKKVSFHSDSCKENAMRIGNHDKIIK